MTNAVQTNRVRSLFPANLDEVDQLFDHFFGANRGGNTKPWRAPASIWEADGTIHIELDLPGVAQDDVELTFEKGVLGITADRKTPDNRENWHNERGFGQITRHVTLPETVDPESIAAELAAGVLHVTVAKLPEAQPKRIEVKTA